MDARVAAGSPTAELDFAEYVATRRPALLRAAHAITRDPDTAEDLLQAALVSVCGRWTTLRHHRAADSYVRRTMVNQHASWFREKWRTRERPFGDLPERGDRPAPVVDEASPADGELWRLVLGLPPRQRAALVLRYYEGLSELETAEVLGCSLGTVKSNTSRALATLRRQVLGTDLGLAG